MKPVAFLTHIMHKRQGYLLMLRFSFCILNSCRVVLESSKVLKPIHVDLVRVAHAIPLELWYSSHYRLGKKLRNRRNYKTHANHVKSTTTKSLYHLPLKNETDNNKNPFENIWGLKVYKNVFPWFSFWALYLKTKVRKSWIF